MNSGRSLFSQLIDHLSLHEFRKCVARYDGNHGVRTFSCWDQFLCMLFAQLTYRESLRDIVACLRSQQRGLYHAGIRGTVSRSTLADANELRDWRIYADFAQLLIRQARALYAHDDLGMELDNTVYALDSTTIDLCMSLFPWARFKPTQHAIKLHTLLDLRAGLYKDAWSVQVWGRNVTNEWYWTAADRVNDTILRYTGMPTTYGVTLSYRFH